MSKTIFTPKEISEQLIHGMHQENNLVVKTKEALVLELNKEFGDTVDLTEIGILIPLLEKWYTSDVWSEMQSLEMKLRGSTGMELGTCTDLSSSVKMGLMAVGSGLTPYMVGLLEPHKERLEGHAVNVVEMAAIISYVYTANDLHTKRAQ